MAPPAFAACVFDLDGVLADSMRQHALAYARVLEPFGVEVPRHEVFAREGMNARHVARELLAAAGKDVSDAEAAQLGDAKQAAFRAMGRPPLYPGVERCLAMLEAAGLGLALVTGTIRDNAAFILGPLASRFAVVVADGDYARSKPDPEPYAIAARRLGSPPAACVVVENAPLGVRSAVAAGMACIALTTTMTEEALRGAGAHAIAGSIEEAAALVLRGQGFKRP